jgi:hypothetical protein
MGGDAFDYAINDSVLHLAVFDGMGHGLAAAGVTLLRCRRTGIAVAATWDRRPPPPRSRRSAPRGWVVEPETSPVADATTRVQRKFRRMLVISDRTDGRFGGRCSVFMPRVRTAGTGVAGCRARSAARRAGPTSAGGVLKVALGRSTSSE